MNDDNESTTSSFNENKFIDTSEQLKDEENS